jgi:hypothetical protein
MQDHLAMPTILSTGHLCGYQEATRARVVEECVVIDERLTDRSNKNSNQIRPLGVWSMNGTNSSVIQIGDPMRATHFL